MFGRRVLRFVHEHGGDLAIGSFVLVVLLAVETARRSDQDVGASMMALKDTIDIGGKVLTMTLGVVGAIATYRRFFKGRLLQPRVKLRLSGRAIRWADVDVKPFGRVRALLHAIDVEIENAGASTVWDPEVDIRIREVDSDEDVGLELGTDGIERAQSPGSLSGVAPSETVIHHYRFRVPAGVPVFRVSVDLASGKHIWHRSITLANQISPSDAPPNGPTIAPRRLPT